MGDMNDTVHAIKGRLAEVDGQLEAVDVTKARLLEERAELVTALKVWGRFADEDEPVGSPEPDLEKRRRDVVEAAEALAERQEQEIEKRKPDDAPTVPEMILEVLLRPHLLDDPGMEPKDITAAIRERWWPDAPSSSIGPIAWRMWKKEGRLVKDGSLYSLPPHGDRAPPGSSSAELSRPRSLFDAPGQTVVASKQEAAG